MSTNAKPGFGQAVAAVWGAVIASANAVGQVAAAAETLASSAKDLADVAKLTSATYKADAEMELLERRKALELL